MALLSYGAISEFHVPFWVMLACALAMASAPPQAAGALSKRLASSLHHCVLRTALLSIPLLQRSSRLLRESDCRFRQRTSFRLPSWGRFFAAAYGCALGGRRQYRHRLDYYHSRLHGIIMGGCKTSAYDSISRSSPAERAKGADFALDEDAI